MLFKRSFRWDQPDFWELKHLGAISKQRYAASLNYNNPRNFILAIFCPKTQIIPIFSRVHATLQPTLSVCRSVGPLVTLSFSLPSYVILSHFLVLTTARDFRGVGLVLFILSFFLSFRVRGLDSL